MKTKIPVIVVSVINSILLIGSIISFVSCGNTPPPPIKRYEYAGDYNQLISKINQFCAGRRDLKFEVTDKIVDQNNRYGIYAIVTTITAGDSVEYGLKFESDPSKTHSTIISTVKAHNNTPKLAGYANQARLIKHPPGEFNSKFLVALQKEQRIKLTPF
jgi:hypothetical protein